MKEDPLSTVLGTCEWVSIVLMLDEGEQVLDFGVSINDYANKQNVNDY